MTVPIVSVIMPVYNAQRYVAAAVRSILAQTYRDFEFLIIDDGSTDRSSTILQRYAATDDRIRLIRRDNLGFVATLNELLQMAQGEYIARMDADDIALPDRFALQVAFLQTHPQVVCVGGAQDWIDAAGRILLHHPEAEDNAAIQQLALTGQTPINHPSAMMRRSAMLQVGGYDANFYPAEDLDLWLKLGELGELANLRQTVLCYRQHDRSISERLQTQQTQQRRAACVQAWQRRGITGTFYEAPPWRPVDRRSRHQFVTMYGWWFFNAGNRSGALAYGLKAIRTLPWAIEGWKLFACALLKPFPPQAP
ncbi:MAG: glycosyltransferase family 2 protein [Elainella sp. Prado103]|nr:glycosyltransferase family 2 protein [Elainella sp. Prado103]